MNTKNLKEKMKKTLPAFLLCGVVGLGALAWLVDTDITDNKSNVSAGQLSVAFINEVNAYNDLNTLPQTRETALAGTPYTFTVKNNGTVDEMVRLSATNLFNIGGVSGQHIPHEKINVVIETDAGLSIYDGTLAGLQEVEESETVTKYMKLVDGVPNGEYYTEEEIEGLEIYVDYSPVSEVIGTVYKAVSGEVFELAPEAEINFNLYAWVDESAVTSDLYDIYEEEGQLVTKARDIQFQLKAFAVQKQDLFVEETDENTLEAQWDALADDVVYDEIFMN